MNLKARRGAVIVMLGIMIVTLVSISAISIDFSRLWTLRNELQTSADAAAHAGAVQLSPPNNAGATDSATRALANANLAMQGTVTVDSVELGDWDDIAKTFTPGAPHTDAVRVVVSRQSNGLIMSIVGVLAPRLKARAIGWADAPVANAAGCIKPWAIPYVTLMYRLNLYHNNNPGDTLSFVPPDSWQNLTRPFRQPDDIDALNNMTLTERTFNLKLGSGTVNDSASSSMPGNYQAVVLPELVDGPTGDTNTVSPDPGGARYRDNIAGSSCHTLDIGDILATEGGVKAGPTIQGVVGGSPANGPGVCAGLRGETDTTPLHDAAFGDCLSDANDNASVGVDIKAAFYYCSSNCNGRTDVEVKLLGSFTLQKVYPQGDNGRTPLFDKAEIVGVFKPITDPGTVGLGSTTLVTPIIVR